MRRTNRDIPFIGIIYNGYIHVKKGVDMQWEENYNFQRDQAMYFIFYSLPDKRLWPGSSKIDWMV